ncbi:hypothetical protein GcLGCM259_1308 [Glutamicibacter creatinolyticus]|uniref:Uncharacterized protein n=1 Tax=Glutamicibacter creatinolyticus TaxID=162496 RepID=A0A5B7WSF7_9MICC|nr:hypothetical protein GcLGCM259_1308 [Glutamicibacter creatinolyticus]
MQRRSKKPNLTRAGLTREHYKMFEIWPAIVQRIQSSLSLVNIAFSKWISTPVSIAAAVTRVLKPFVLGLVIMNASGSKLGCASKRS